MKLPTLLCLCFLLKSFFNLMKSFHNRAWKNLCVYLCSLDICMAKHFTDYFNW